MEGEPLNCAAKSRGWQSARAARRRDSLGGAAAVGEMAKISSRRRAGRLWFARTVAGSRRFGIRRPRCHTTVQASRPAACSAAAEAETEGRRRTRRSSLMRTQRAALGVYMAQREATREGRRAIIRAVPPRSLGRPPRAPQKLRCAVAAVWRPGVLRYRVLFTSAPLSFPLPGPRPSALTRSVAPQSRRPCDERTVSSRRIGDGHP